MHTQPRVKFAYGQKELKGEDVAFVHEEWKNEGCVWNVFCICDGHGGAGAARYVERNLLDALGPVLPPGPPPNLGTEEGRAWASAVAKATAEAFVALDEDFARVGCGSGTTVSLALLCGWLVTVANVGDSDAYMDTGMSIQELTCSHKVHTNEDEQQRLGEVGALVDSLSHTMLGPPLPGEHGIGPLRVWPGGVAVSRSLGDFDCSQHIVPVPHIRQVVIPPTGGRLLLATDGLWDFFSGQRACRIVRNCQLEKSPARLFRALMFQTDGCLVDDTTMLVVDVLPQKEGDFKDVVKTLSKQCKPGILSTIKRYMCTSMQDCLKDGVELYGDMDGVEAYEGLVSQGVIIYGNLKYSCDDLAPSSRRTLSKKFAYAAHVVDELRDSRNPEKIFDKPLFRDDSAQKSNLCKNAKD